MVRVSAQGRVMKPGRPSDSQKTPRKTSALLIPEAEGTQQQRNAALQSSRFSPWHPLSQGGRTAHSCQAAGAGGGVSPLCKDKMATPKFHPFSASLDGTQEPPPAPGWPMLSPSIELQIHGSRDPQRRCLSSYLAKGNRKIRLGLAPSPCAAGSAEPLLSCPPWKA